MHFNRKTGKASTVMFSRVSQFILILSFIESIAGSISYHIAYFFSSSTQLDKLSIGIMGFLMGVGSIVGSIYGGYATGKHQESKMISACLMLVGISFVILSVSQAYMAIIVSMLQIGFGVSCFITCSNSIFLHSSKEHEQSLTLAQSYKNALENAGCLVAMLLVAVLAKNYFNHLMFILGINLLILSIYVLLKFEYTNRCLESGYVGEKQEVFQKKTRSKPLALMLGSVFFIGLTYGIQKTVLGVHLNESLGSPFIIGIFFAADPLLIVIFQVKLARSLEEFNKHIVVAIGSLLLGLSAYAMSLSSNMIEMFISLLVFTVGEMLFMAHSVALCHSYGSQNHKGLGIGAWRSAYSLGMMLGPLLSGFAMFYSSAQAAWIISSLLCFLGTLFVALAGKASVSSDQNKIDVEAKATTFSV